MQSADLVIFAVNVLYIGCELNPASFNVCGYEKEHATNFTKKNKDESLRSSLSP